MSDVLLSITSKKLYIYFLNQESIYSNNHVGKKHNNNASHCYISFEVIYTQKQQILTQYVTTLHALPLHITIPLKCISFQNLQ